MTRHRRMRPGAVYAIQVLRPGRIVDRYGYVGKTRQAPLRRVQQHADSKPWGPDIVGWTAMWRSQRCSALRLWWEEVWRIVLYRPLYNYQWNRWNPRRIPIHEQHATPTALRTRANHAGRLRPVRPVRPEGWSRADG